MVLISGLTAATSAADADLIELETSGGASRKITKANYLKDIKDGTGISSNAITTAKINDGAVTNTKLSTSAITLGYAEITTSYGPASTTTTDVDITGVTVTVTVPAGGRRLKLTLAGGGYAQSGGIGTIYGIMKLKEGTTVLDSNNVVPVAANLPQGFTLVTSFVPTAGSHTYKFSVANNTAGPTFTLGASATSKITLLAELI